MPHVGQSLTMLHYGKKISNSLTSDLNLTVVITRAMTLQPSPSPSYTNPLPPALFPPPISFTLVLKSAGNYTRMNYNKNLQELLQCFSIKMIL